MTREATGSIPVPCVQTGSSVVELGCLSPACVGSIPAPSACGAEALRRGSGSNDFAAEGSTPSRAPKLYAVVRADLPAGLRVAQVGHALIAWVLAHGAPPDNLVVLSVPDEAALLSAVERCPGRSEVFREPDLGGEATAVAVGPESWRELSSLPLLR